MMLGFWDIFFNMTKPEVNYHGLLGLLQNFEKNHQLHKESVNLVGGLSSGSRPFKKGKKNKKKKVKKVQVQAGHQCRARPKRSSPIRVKLNASYARSEGTERETILSTLPPWT